MRIWDVNPGYLNRQSLLGEHRELHAVVSIIVNRKKGYARHPETMRWQGRGWALRQRHRLLAEEMALRGFNEKTPVRLRSAAGLWPERYIDRPEQQFQILSEKYRFRCQGRIPLPETTRQLWDQHHYSVLARDPDTCRLIDRTVSRYEGRRHFAELAGQLSEVLRQPPPADTLRYALLRMWEDASGHGRRRETPAADGSLPRLLREIRRLARQESGPSRLATSTALSDLGTCL